MDKSEQIEQLREYLDSLPDGVVKDTVRVSLAKLEAAAQSEEKKPSPDDVAVQRAVDCNPQLFVVQDALCLVLHFIFTEQGIVYGITQGGMVRNECVV